MQLIASSDAQRMIDKPLLIASLQLTGQAGADSLRLDRTN